MPELPEVEVISQGVASGLTGRSIVEVRVSNLELRLPVPMESLTLKATGIKIKKVLRRAKYIVLRLENKTSIILHLGMTGRLGIFPAEEKPAKHDHVRFRLDNCSELRFNDTRRFGSVQFFDSAQEEENFFSRLGPEPFSKDFTADYLNNKSAARLQPVKNFLMDSRVVVGVGNIYASEILHEAKISPARPVGKISVKEWRSIVEHTRAVLKRAIAAGGSTISDYVNSQGEKGYFQHEFKVYGRTGLDCRRCGAIIIKDSMAGRATFWCDKCQS